MREEVNILTGAMVPEAAQTARTAEIGFDEAFTLYHRTVFRVARGVVSDCALAEDVTQEVFLRLYKHLDAVPSDDLLKAWLIRVTINVARNAIRGNTRATARDDAFFKENEHTTAATEPELDFERKMQIEEVRRALAKVKEPMRSCLMLKQQGLSYKEIAAALSLNETSIGTFVARARKEFLRFYGKFGVKENETF
jgi:RNA polymerase sigma factor (sigma-70 family)